MSWPLLVAWSFLPGILWLIWIRKKDRYEPEPWRQLLKVYAVGLLTTFPAAISNEIGLYFFPGQGAGVLSTAIACFGIIGPGEEFWKLGAVYLLMAKHKDLNEPMDGLVYAGIGALGFASLENVYYLETYGAGTLLLRTITAVPGHFLFAAPFGFALGMCVHRGVLDRGALLRGWAYGALAHGLYDFLLFVEVPVLGLTAMGLLIGLGFLWRHYARVLLALSPFQPGASLAFCTPCQRPLPPDSRFCDACGKPAN